MNRLLRFLHPPTSALVLAALGVALLAPAVAQAGIPECGNIRLEDAGSCELKGDIECSAGCEEFGIYKTACATKLHTVCREDCTLLAEPTCTDECTTACSEQCDLGVNVICQHNCFGECVGSCDVTCEGASDMATCRASCEATCDGECDIQCAPVVDGSCYEHCVECCGGSCGAQANMDCQTTCQEESFEDCEHEFRADCDASCSGSGVLFCDGNYISVTGDQLLECFNALLDIGVSAIDLRVEGEVELELDGSGLCTVGDSHGAPIGTALLALGVVGLTYTRRRKYLA